MHTLYDNNFICHAYMLIIMHYMLIIGVATLIYSEGLGGVFLGRLGVAQSACDLLSDRVKVTTTQRFLKEYQTYTHIYDNNPLLHTHMIIITKL